MNNNPHLLGVLVTTGGLSLAMTWLAVRTSLIELRQPPKCPACGRLRRFGACDCSA
jgi:hypothetical protein